MARKLHEPANERYQFGYAKYEPLMTTVEGVLLAGACVGAIVYAVRDLIHPDPVEDARSPSDVPSRSSKISLDVFTV